MMKKQHYMTRDERYQLEAYLRAGKPVAWIAREMGFCERTIYYEKNAGPLKGHQSETITGRLSNIQPTKPSRFMTTTRPPKAVR